MGGGGQVVIISHAKHVLSDPLVSGALPSNMEIMVQEILAKDAADWTIQDKRTAAHAIQWALLNIA